MLVGVTRPEPDPPTAQPTPRQAGASSLTRFAWLSIAAAVATIMLKTGAFLLTGSVGLLSDALESTVNLAAAVVALVVLRVASRPADHNHHFGHGKAEYFSAGVEGLMIFFAATAIVATSIQRLLDLRELEQLGFGIGVTLLATVINAAVAFVLLRAGRRYRSITLVADGRHLLTDVWTSVGVIVGVIAVNLTGWLVLDPLIALAVGVNILVTGAGLLRRSTAGLMDTALPAADHEQIVTVLRRFRSEQVHFHAIQTREAGQERHVSVHVLVPGSWTVQHGHDLLEEVEEALRSTLPGIHVHTHLEPLEDPRAWADADVGHDVLP